MCVPSLTERKHYRVVPDQPEEPTSTIVLTSKDSYFVDVRLLKTKLEEEQDKEENTKACIEWAFAGESRCTPKKSREDGTTQPSHTVWDHWIDSKSSKPDIDEGDMFVLENGDVLERGKSRNAETGEEIEYEELWHDLDVVPLGKKNNHNSVVMTAEEPDQNLRGMVVKIGGCCQGILKVGDNLTVERWEYKPGSVGGAEERETLRQEGPLTNTRTYNEWTRTFRFGVGDLPCKMLITETNKLGLHFVLNSRAAGWKGPIGTPGWDSPTEWKVCEEYFW